MTDWAHDAAERALAGLLHTPADTAIVATALRKAREAGALDMRERAAKEASNPDHGLSAWRARSNIESAIRSLPLEGT